MAALTGVKGLQVQSIRDASALEDFGWLGDGHVVRETSVAILRWAVISCKSLDQESAVSDSGANSHHRWV